MAVIKYKMYLNEQGRRAVPGYVQDRGHWGDGNGNYIGWADMDGKFYIDTNNATTMTKAEFVTYATPMNSEPAGWDADAMGAWEATDLEAWYDAFVAANS